MAGPKASVTSAPSAPTWPTPGAVGGRCQQLFGGGSQGLRTGPCSGPWGRASLGNHVLRRAGPPPGPPVCVFALLPERPETSVLSKPRFRQFILDPETALHVKRRRKAGAGGRACPMPRTRAGWSLPSPRVPSASSARAGAPFSCAAWYSHAWSTHTGCWQRCPQPSGGPGLRGRPLPRVGVRLGALQQVSTWGCRGAGQQG